MKKITLLVITLFSLAFHSCSSDDNNESITPGNDDNTESITPSGDDNNESITPLNLRGELLKKVTKTNLGVLISTTNYEYDNQKRLTKIIFDQGDFGDRSTIRFVYNDTDLLEMIISKVDPFGDTSEETRTFEYANGNIINVCKIVVNKDEDFTDYTYDRIGYSYDINGNNSQIDHYSPISTSNADNIILCNEIINIDSDEKLVINEEGNMIRYEVEDFFSGRSYFEYTYDDKNHPESGNTYTVYKKLLGYSVVNNINSLKQFSAETNQLIATASFEHEYNAKGFPVKIIRTFNTEGIAQVRTEFYEYY